MAVVVEDGTNVADANSFVTQAEYLAWATERGYVVPASPIIEQNIIKAADYLYTFENEYGGDRLFDDQPLPFPRTGQYINDVLIADGTIPPQVKKAQFAVTYTIGLGIDLFPASAERALKRQKTGPLEKEWFDSNTVPSTPLIDAAIEPLLGSGAFALTVRRI